MAQTNLSQLRPLKKFSEYQAEQPFAHELPYWDILGDTVVLADGSLVKGLSVRGIAIETFDSDRINQLTLGWRSLLNALPDGIEVGFLSECNSNLELLIAAHEKERAQDLASEVRWISDNRILNLREQVKNGDLLKSDLTLFIYRRFGGESDSKTKSIFKSFLSSAKDFPEIKVAEHEHALKELGQTVESLKAHLASLGLSIGPIDSHDAWKQIYQFVNPLRSKTEPTPKLNHEHREQEFLKEEIEKCPALSLPSPREQLCFSSVVQGYESFFLDSYYHRIITLKTLPEFTHASLVARLQALPFPHRLYIHVKVPEQSKELSNLQSKRRMAHSMSMSHGGRATDLESESRLQSTEELLRELINTGQKIFYFQGSILLQAKDKDELNLQTKAVLSRMREMNGAEGLNETVAGFKLWKTMLPFGNTAMVRPKRIKTDNLADFLPLYQDYDGLKNESSRPVCLFRNRSNGLVAYDPFDQNLLPNFNSLVTGSSGAGKSFLNNLILFQYVTKSPLIYTIDVGGSYRKLCEFLHGQYIEVSPPRLGETCKPINPFHLPNGTVEPTPQKIKFLLALMESVLSDDDSDKLKKLDKSLLEEAIVETYKSIRSKHSRVPTLSDFESYLTKSGEPSLKNFAKMLYPWTGERPYGRLLDAQNELDFDNDVVVFDLKGLSSYPDLQSVMILIITDFILGKVESKELAHRQKRILMDEAWGLLRTNASHFMEYCARVLRKSGSGITFITQSLDEVIASPIGAAILANTATKFILMQRGDMDPIRQILKLNDQEMSLIASLGQSKGQYSEAFMIANEDRAVIRICPTPLEYWLATSDALDNSVLQEARNKNPEKSLCDHIYELANRYPFGIAASRGKNDEFKAMA